MQVPTPELQTIDERSASVQKTTVELIREYGPSEGVTKNHLEMLNRASPAGSSTSLERYLACPPIEEAVSIASIAEAVNGSLANSIHHFTTLSATTSPSCPSMYGGQAHSRAGSAISYVSSYGSARSADIRGSRRGRKQWTRINRQRSFPISLSTASSPRTSALCNARSYGSLRYTSMMTNSDGEQTRELSESVVPSPDDPHTIFCTWPSCDATFKHRYDWIRHEGPIHYQPSRWLCCNEAAADIPLTECYVCDEKNITTSHIAQEHFSTCRDKEESERDFWRKDHLADHIKRVHHAVGTGEGTVLSPRLKVSEHLLAAWRSDNPSFPELHLQCGFCGHISKDWDCRNSHVYQHFGTGANKSAWTPTTFSSGVVDALASPGSF
jgi:hypothetical protein